MISKIAVCFLLTAISVFAQTPRSASTPSVVYVAHDSAAIDHYRTNSAVVHALVDRLVLAVTGQSDVGKAWRSLVSPSDKVGIKISTAGGPLFTTHRDVVNAIVDGLVAAGHPRSRIVVWDRELNRIKEAGYRPEAEGYQLLSIVPRDGYDAKAMVTAPLMGKLIWGDHDYKGDRGKIPLLSDTENTSDRSYFCRIVSTGVTKIINVPVMSANEMNGISGCLYNVTIPNVDNWRRFSEGSGFGASSIADLYSNPIIARKVVFNLMDGLVAEYAGGPEPATNYAMHHATLYASKDPVAIDAMALRKIEEWRKQFNVPPIGQIAGYVEIASQLGLGNFDRNRIEIRNVGR